MQSVINSVQCGDAEHTLKLLPDDSIDLVVTSPPYFQQRIYNGMSQSIGQENDPEQYLNALLKTFAQCVRVVKPSGNIVYNLGDKYQSGSLLLLPYRFAIRAINEFRVKLINDITWVKRNPTPRQFDRRLVSSTEPFFHFALGNSYFYDRARFMTHDSRVNRPSPTSKLGSKYRKLITESTELDYSQKQLAHSELDEVIAEVHAGKIYGFRMKIKGVHAEAFGGQEGGRKGQMTRKGFTIIRMNGEKMKRDVIESTVETLPGNRHTAIFPQSIIRELIRLLSPCNGVVLDPYIGSGTTAVASIVEGRRYIGIDIDPDYCAAARDRISQVELNYG